LTSRSKITSEFGEATIEIAQAVPHFCGDHQAASRK